MSKQHIVIIGAGFAGVYAALSAATERERLGALEQLEITVVAPGDALLIRPRLYESDTSGARVPLASILDLVGVRHLRAEVVGIDTASQCLDLKDGETLGYDQLVLCAGSQRAHVLAGTHDYGIDTWEESTALHSQIARLTAGGTPPRVVVIGAGFTGLEAAAELASTGLAVTLVDGAAHIAPDFGANARREIERALAGLGVNWETGQSATALPEGGVQLADGRELVADINLWTTTLHASPLHTQLGVTLDELGRLPVDETLAAAGSTSLWVAGDGARVLMDGEHVAPMSCQCAMPQGMVVGTNAVRAALGERPLQYQQFRYTTCLDLGAAGALLTGGFERDDVYASGDEAKPFKRFINRSLIYPPTEGGREYLLQAGRVEQPSRDEAAQQLRALRELAFRNSLTEPATDRAALSTAELEASHA